MLFSRFLRPMASIFVAVVALTAVAEAQQDPGEGRPSQRGARGGFQGGFGGFGGSRGGFGGGAQYSRSRLLTLQQVRDELKIEEGQAALIDAAVEAFREEQGSSGRPDRDAFQNMSDEERRQVIEKMQKDREAATKKNDEVLSALLDETQNKRLDQITLQLRLSSGLAAALRDDDLRKALKISDEQVAKLDAAEEESRNAMREMMEGLRGSRDGGDGGGRPPGGGRPDPAVFEQMRERMSEAREKSTAAVMAVLTDGQQTQLEGMKGAPFELDMRAMMRRGAPGGAPGGGFGGQRGGAPGGGFGGQRGGAPGSGFGGQRGGRGRGNRPDVE